MMKAMMMMKIKISNGIYYIFSTGTGPHTIRDRLSAIF
jgi:hypothetical protein